VRTHAAPVIPRRFGTLCGIVILSMLVLSACATKRQEQIRGGMEHGVPSIWPVPYASCRITSTFGTRNDPRTGRPHSHNGIDLAAPKGTPVAAAADGVVIYAGRAATYGRIVRIAHSHGIETWYAHLKEIDVDIGDKVPQGRLIGTIGDSGNATGPNLHYEVHVNGEPVDPRRYLP
jgi:murein DD-endopeptidase MepM/ murein hydrolase activator NlpD